MIFPALTGHEARLLLDHLDNVRAANLPADEYGRYWAAKIKLIEIEAAAEVAAATEARAA